MRFAGRGWSAAAGLAAFGWVVFLSGCDFVHHVGVLEKIENIPTDTAVAVAASSELTPLRADSVPAKVPDGRAFHVLARRKELTQFPCSTCHAGQTPIPAVSKDAVKRRTHWQIDLHHADASVMRCATCHGGESQNELKTLNGKPVTFDDAYLVCRSCHFQQFKDWSGGAHGKRHKNWQGPRVVWNCTACHNPHAPAIQSRWPVTYPTLGRKP